MTKIQNYNIRVYGLLIEDDHVLITHENRANMMMTKFPGGGHEYGEGLKDCVEREFREELSINVKAERLFYVNDFLQVSAFNSSEQLMSFYFTVSTHELDKIIFEKSKELDMNEQIFEWVKLKDLNEKDFTFPLDKKVVTLLKLKF